MTGVKKNFLKLTLDKSHFITEKRKFVAEEADEREFQRTYQYLLRRGFRSSDILKVMKAKPEF